MSTQLRIGVFIAAETQLLDFSTIDFLGCMSREYLVPLKTLPGSIASIAPSVKFFYIASSAESDGVLSLTCNATLRATNFYTDEDVSPGKLDLIVVPGPPPDATFNKDALAWLKRQSETEGVDILSVCSGIYVCAAAGVAKGKTVSGPRGLQDDLKAKFGDMKLAGDEFRWVRDGNFWSSGGITNGNDLMIAYARNSKHFPNALVDFALLWTDIEDRGQKYRTGKTWFTASMVWTFIRAYFVTPAKK